MPTAVAAGTAQLTWNAYPGSDFREYKLYRHTSAALDESTGTLVHVGLARGEAQFVDEVRPGDVYFYRVFVMNDYGRLAGSNIVKLEMANANLVQGGDFEADAAGRAPAAFTVPAEQSWLVSDARAHSGTRALRGTGDFSSGTSKVTQRIPGKLLSPGARYRLSYFYLRESFDAPEPGPDEGPFGNYTRLYVLAAGMTSADISHQTIHMGTDTTWQADALHFTAPWGGDAVVEVYVDRGRSSVTQTDWVIWIDDLKLERVLE